ncbi:MAG: class 1 fructose-bisphosphatase [Ahrensia sp.]|nr:class 1 fructose-bisphosphatase [Ahrensia sp.]
MTQATLDAHLNTFTATNDPVKAQIAETVRAFAAAAILVRKSINEGALGAAFAGTRGNANAGGDTQKELDVHADNLFLDAARKAGIGYYASEELANPVAINPDSKIAVAIDPLDGSSNIDTNVSIGTIFSIVPRREDAATTFAQPGSEQLAAGFFIYGPQMALVLTKRNGTRIFVFSSRLGTFVEAYSAVTVAPMASEFAINMSNYRHWDETTRLYIDDCLAGMDGPREKDFNMRWIASLVADTYRILIRGGVFLYPRDSRKGYSLGRLRLIYEAAPIALLIEQAGGAATDGGTRILDLVPGDVHQRTPLVFGSKKEVEKIARYHTDPSAIGTRHPLFANRGLFRA